MAHARVAVSVASLGLVVSLGLAGCEADPGTGGTAGGASPSSPEPSLSSGASSAGGAGESTPRPRDIEVGLALNSGAPAVAVADRPSPTASASPSAGPSAGGDREPRTRLGRVVDALGVSVRELSPGEEVGRATVLRRLARQGADVVLAVGAAYAEPVEQVAAEFPETRFALVDDASVRADNVTNLVFAEEEAAFLVGAAAALKSTTGTVGLVIGEGAARSERFLAGYRAGVRHVRADGRVEVQTVPPPPDPAEAGAGADDAPDPARLAVERLARAGADVVFAVAAERDVLEAAQSLGLKGVGVEVGEPAPVPPPLDEVVLTSLVKRLDEAVAAFVASVVEGDPLTGVQVFDLERGGVGWTRTPQIAGIAPRLERLERQVVTGSVAVPPTPQG